MKKKYYILIAVIAYITFLLMTVPAQFITGIIGDNSPVTMQGVSGTLWNGKAYLVSAPNRVQLNNTAWSFKPWKLLIGKIALDVSTRFAGKEISTELGTSFLGRYFVNDLSGEVAANDIAQIASLPFAQVSGLLSLNIEHAEWKQGELPLAAGEIKWKDATVTVADTASLGDISITLGESDQQQLIAADDVEGRIVVIEAVLH